MMNSLNKLAQEHYENFPVGSRFIPAPYREPIHLIYAFARVADDIADEGLLNPEERLRRLNEWEVQFLEHVSGIGEDDFFLRLSSSIKAFDLPIQPFLDLLKAFRQDSLNPSYQSFPELVDYSRYSANPVGRLMLKIFRSSNAENDALSDYLCTALQLTNFWQDISVDTRRNRFYIPLNELAQFGLELSDLKNPHTADAFGKLLHRQVERTRELFFLGRPLIGLVHKDLRFELKLIWHGGMRILEKIEAMKYDTRSNRPELTAADTIRIFMRALRT